MSSFCAQKKLELAVLTRQGSTSLCTALAFLLCSVTVLTIPTLVSPQPSDSDSGEKETIAQEATTQKIVSVLIRPHEGVPADNPYSITPRQTVSFYIFSVLRLSMFSAGDGEGGSSFGWR